MVHTIILPTVYLFMSLIVLRPFNLCICDKVEVDAFLMLYMLVKDLNTESSNLWFLYGLII